MPHLAFDLLYDFNWSAISDSGTAVSTLLIPTVLSLRLFRSIISDTHVFTDRWNNKSLLKQGCPLLQSVSISSFIEKQSPSFYRLLRVKSNEFNFFNFQQQNSNVITGSSTLVHYFETYYLFFCCFAHIRVYVTSKVIKDNACCRHSLHHYLPSDARPVSILRVQRALNRSNPHGKSV